MLPPAILPTRDFRTLQVGEDGDFLSGTFCRFTHDAGVFLMEFRRAVAEVETDDIQTAYTDHVFQQLDIVAARPQRSDDLVLWLMRVTSRFALLM